MQAMPLHDQRSANAYQKGPILKCLMVSQAVSGAMNHTVG